MTKDTDREIQRLLNAVAAAARHGRAVKAEAREQLRTAIAAAKEAGAADARIAAAAGLSTRMAVWRILNDEGRND